MLGPGWIGALTNSVALILILMAVYWNARKLPGCVMMSRSSCGRLARNVVVLRRLSRRCRLGRRLRRMRGSRTASGRLVISGFVMPTEGKICTALLIWQWQVRACLEMLVGFENCRTGTMLPVFILRPDIHGADLSRVLEDFTLREFAQFAMPRAEPQSRRMAGLGEVLRILEDGEMGDAEQFARRSTNERDEQLRRASLPSMENSVRGHSPWSSQIRLVSAALRGSVEEVEQILRTSSAGNVNPLVSLHSADLPYHDGVAHWPMHAWLAAGFELSSDSDLRDKLRVIRQMIVEWERKLIRLFRSGVVLLNSGQCERLKLPFREIRWCKGTQFKR